MSRPYHHGALRVALLAAAEVILERDGVEALTLRAAAREAGVSHGSPAHHFGDLSGLLSELAAIGFVRFRERLHAEAEAADARARRIGMCRGYVGFARDSPGLFLLMFRSGRLDWGRPALAAAGAQAFALLTDPATGSRPAPLGAAGLADAISTWSLAHGLAMLLIDGRLEPMVDRVSGLEVGILIEAVLTGALPLERE